MQASTDSACLRKLSDCVNSVSNPQAAARSFMFSSLFSLYFARSFGFRNVMRTFCTEIVLDFHRCCTAKSLHSELVSSSKGCHRSGHSHISMATTLAPVDSREVVRCDRCQLVQFRTTNNMCRRCHGSLDEDEPEIAAVTPMPQMMPTNGNGRGHLNLAASIRSLTFTQRFEPTSTGSTHVGAAHLRLEDRERKGNADTCPHWSVSPARWRSASPIC